MADLDFTELEKRIEYSFKDKELLKRAFTHPSYDNVNNYERLEFLGDAVLELSVSTAIFNKNPRLDEGELSKIRSCIVRSSSLAEIAKRIELGNYMLLGKGEEKSGGREKTSILENTTEALIGAIYLDSDFETVNSILLNILPIEELMNCTDNKSLFQERVQKKGNANIEYRFIKSEGPPHDSTFYIDLYVNGKYLSSGKGKSKKKAEQDAANMALKIYK